MLYTERAFAALELPSVPTIIEPWLPTQSISLVFGPPSAGKSLWMMSVARALATGGQLFGTYHCAKSKVLIVQADMPVNMVQERVQASAANASDDILLWLTENRQLDILNAHKTHANEIARIREFAPDVVFVDTLRKTHTLDENDSSAPDKVYGAWRTLFPQTTFLFQHHARKVSQTDSPDAAVREAFRGSVAWAASADTIIAIRRARRKGAKHWLVQQRFVRTRGCQEPPPLLLKSTEDLLLEPVHVPVTLEERLERWLLENPTAPQKDAVAWLRTLTDDKGRTLCDRRRAYRVFNRVRPGLIEEIL